MPFWNLLNAGSIKESGLFQADPYRVLYLRNSQFRFFPLFHYLLIGEWSGCRPNAFFDPAFFNSTAGTKQLWKYLKKKKLWKQKTSSSFDGAFYCAKVGAARSCSIAPLVDFWHHGFDRGVGCSDSFDMSFFQTATTRDRGDKKAIAFSGVHKPGKIHILGGRSAKATRQFLQAHRSKSLKRT